jgi:hypothetical protein
MKTSNTKFRKNPSSGSRVDTDGRMDVRRDLTNVLGTFRDLRDRV